MSTVAPGATTAALAGAVSKESEKPQVPGGFPETPGTEPQSFSVTPIPATAGAGNPIHLAPGEKVPDPSTITSNTVSSTAKTDAASYEKSDAAVASGEQAKPAETGAGMFGVPPVTKNMIPESSLPLNAAAGAGESDPGVTIQSAAPGSTTAALAGQVPKEPRGVPEVVQESEREAGAPPEAAASPEAVAEKSEVEKELKEKVPEEPATSAGGGITGALAAAGAAAAGAAAYAQKAVNSVTGQTAHETATTDEVPTVVSDSILKADQPFEAAANPEAVADKQAVEKELEKHVPPTDAAGEPAPTVTAESSATAPGDKPAISALTSGEPLKSSEENAPPVASTDVSPGTTPAATTSVETKPTETKTEAPKDGTAASSAAGSSTAKPAESGKKDKEEKKKKRFSFFKKLGERLK